MTFWIIVLINYDPSQAEKMLRMPLKMNSLHKKKIRAIVVIVRWRF
jgi:hypothetical protein